MKLFNFLKKKMEISDFIRKFLQTIAGSNVLLDMPSDKFTKNEIDKIHEELCLFRYVIFSQFLLDMAKEGLIDGLDSHEAGIIGTLFKDSLRGVLNEKNQENSLDVMNALKDYDFVLTTKTREEYAQRGYFFIVEHCLVRCGYKVPPERNNDVDPVTKDEGVLDLINQAYLAMQNAFARTFRNYPPFFQKR